MTKGPYYYETRLRWTGARQGRIDAPELPAVPVSAPPEFDGEAGLWSPEHLLVSAVETCLMTTFLAIAEKSRIETLDYESSSHATLEWADDGGLRFTELTVRPRIEVASGAESGKTVRIVEKAHKHCLVSNALNFPVHVVPEITVRVSPAVTAEGELFEHGEAA
jgi:organic hydroperoxide reductase OsmC/OhrA